jgi:SNF2 family DNA or RNA helicase
LRYCNAKRRRMKLKTKEIAVWDNKGASNLEELREQIKPFILRRMKSKCLDLPPKTRIFREAEISTEMDKKFKEVLKKCKADWQAKVDAGDISDESESLVMVNFMRKAASLAKMDTSLEIAREVMTQGHSVLIFTEFVDTAKEFAKALGTKPFYGDLTKEQRQPIIDDFQAGLTKAFCATGASAGTGLNLTTATYCILNDRPFVPGDAEQWEDRAYRIGQDKPYTTIWVQAFEIDFKVDDILINKQGIINQVLSGQKSNAGMVTKISAQRLLKAMFNKQEYE